MCLFTFSTLDNVCNPVLSLVTLAGGDGSAGPSILMSCGAMMWLSELLQKLVDELFGAVVIAFQQSDLGRPGVLFLKMKYLPASIWMIRHSLFVGCGDFRSSWMKINEGLLLTCIDVCMDSLSSAWPLLWRVLYALPFSAAIESEIEKFQTMYVGRNTRIKVFQKNNKMLIG